MGVGVLHTARIVLEKELRSSLRDPQTLVYTLLLPLALYPVLFWVLIQVHSVVEGRREVRETRAEVVAEGPQARERAESLRSQLGQPEGGEEGAQALVLGPGVRMASLGELSAELADGEPSGSADAALFVPSDPDGPLLLVHLGSKPNSVLAADRLEARLSELAQEERERRVLAALLDGRELPGAPFALKPRDLSSGAQQGAYLLSVMLPMFAVLMAVFGAFYPAVDLTAGERERRTEETTLLVPAPRTGLWLGKLGAVSLLALLAAGVNLAGVALAANHLLAMLGADGIEVRVSAAQLALALPFVLVLVVLVAAVLLGLGSLTQTFKQGQSLLGGAQMVFLLPAMASTLPGLTLTPGLAAAPVVGLSLALRQVLRGETLEPMGLAVAFLSHGIYAALACFAALALLSVELNPSGSALARLRKAFFPRSAP